MLPGFPGEKMDLAVALRWEPLQAGKGEARFPAEGASETLGRLPKRRLISTELTWDAAATPVAP